MKKIRLKNIVNIMCICLCLLCIFTTFSYATDSPDDWVQQGKDFINTGSKGNTINVDDAKNALMPVGQTLVAIASVILVVVTIVMGIKWMLCESADEKAKLKTQLIGLTVSVIVIFGAQIIWATVLSFMQTATS